MTHHESEDIGRFWLWRLGQAHISAQETNTMITHREAQAQATNETYAKYPKIPRKEIQEILKRHLKQQLRQKSGKPQHKPLVVLIEDNAGKGIADWRTQGLPADFRWVSLDPNEPEEALQAIKEIIDDATEPEFKEWLEEMREMFTELDDEEDDE